jgi:hypothetical protein
MFRAWQPSPETSSSRAARRGRQSGDESRALDLTLHGVNRCGTH